MKKLIIIAATLVIISSSYFYINYQKIINERIKINSEKEIEIRKIEEIEDILEKNNNGIKDILNEFLNSIYCRVNTNKLNIKELSFSNADKINSDEIDCIVKSHKENEEEYELTTVKDYFEIKELYKKENNRFFATLYNKEYDKIEVEIENMLFGKFKDIVLNAFSNNKLLNVEISIREKTFKDGRIIKINEN